MVELVDTLALGASASNGLGVRLSLWAPKSGGYSPERIRRIRVLSDPQECRLVLREFEGFDSCPRHKMDKEKGVGRFLMNDGRIHILSLGAYSNGIMYSRSIHVWPDGHSSDCQIPYSPQSKPEEEIAEWVSENIQNGTYVAQIRDED